MPIGIVFREGDALAFDRMADNCAWPVVRERQPREGSTKRRYIVAVDIDSGKVESPPLVEQRFKILNFPRRPCRLDLVVINNGGKVGKPVLTSAHRRFPNRTFVNLTVTHHNDDTAVALLHSRGKRHTNAKRQAVAKCAGRSLDSRNFAALRMPPEN